MQINFGEHKLLQLAESEGFKPFNSDTFKQAHLVSLALAFLKLRSIGGHLIGCNEGFKKLPGGRSFEEVFNDNNVWISYGSKRITKHGCMVGAHVTDGIQHDIAVNTWAFTCLKNSPDAVEAIAAIIVHEMAHVNGAPNKGNLAESMLLCCGFGAHYDASIDG